MRAERCAACGRFAGEAHQCAPPKVDAPRCGALSRAGRPCRRRVPCALHPALFEPAAQS